MRHAALRRRRPRPAAAGSGPASQRTFTTHEARGNGLATVQNTTLHFRPFQFKKSILPEHNSLMQRNDLTGKPARFEGALNIHITQPVRPVCFIEVKPQGIQ